MELNHKQAEALVDAIATLTTLEENKLYPVKSTTLDGLTDILGYIPENKKVDEQVFKVPPKDKEGTFSDAYMS